MMFVNLSRADHKKANLAGAGYSLWNSDLENGPDDEMLSARLVCDWSLKTEQIDRFLDIMRGI